MLHIGGISRIGVTKSNDLRIESWYGYKHCMKVLSINTFIVFSFYERIN